MFIHLRNGYYQALKGAFSMVADKLRSMGELKIAEMVETQASLPWQFSDIRMWFDAGTEAIFRSAVVAAGWFIVEQNEKTRVPLAGVFNTAVVYPVYG